MAEPAYLPAHRACTSHPGDATGLTATAMRLVRPRRPLCRSWQLKAILVILLSLWAGLMCPELSMAGGGFAIAGRAVEPHDINFAGARRSSPTYGITVQINHDAQTSGRLELAVVDEVFQALLAQHRRAPYLPAQSLPVVIIADLKMRRFLAGPRRLLFGKLETEIKTQQDVYLAPTAIFITDAAIADADRLRASLRLGLGYLFNEDFYHAILGLEHAIPRPAE
ncbi:MAG TPA: hypothetical protein VNP04_27520 [Alphaproteobacteria bacterium]|nr:hypothetical protein [Alphaproteobacteria bacterium]